MSVNGRSVSASLQPPACLKPQTHDLCGRGTLLLPRRVSLIKIN